jgi:hypothetical protein
MFPFNFLIEVNDDEPLTRTLTSYDKAVLAAVTKTSFTNIWALAVTNRGSVLSFTSLSRRLSDANYSPRTALSLDEELEQTAEELISGDSDDASHGNEAVREALSKHCEYSEIQPKIGELAMEGITLDFGACFGYFSTTVYSGDVDQAERYIHGVRSATNPAFDSRRREELWTG